MAARANRYARWALDQNLAKGETVCLMMPNRPEYMAVWLGLTSVGVVVALVNTQLRGLSLAHCIDIRAPQNGMVLQSTVHTVGGVITAGDAIMLIVPQSDDLQVEAKVNPQDIDKLQVGQKTLLRLSALNQRTTPELNGVVSRVIQSMIEL